MKKLFHHSVAPVSRFLNRHLGGSVPGPGHRTAAVWCCLALALVATAGRASAQYVETAIPVSFDDISATGTAVVLGDDQVSGAIPLPFPFEFFGVTYNDVYISSNGFVTFLPGQYNGCCAGNDIPTAGDTVDGFIAGAWNDIYPPGGGQLRYQTLGAPGSRVFVVMFNNVPNCCSGPGSYTFNIKLFETTNVIESHIVAADSDGSDTTVGIENETGTAGVRSHFGSGDLFNVAFRYSTDTAVNSYDFTSATYSAPEGNAANTTNTVTVNRTVSPGAMVPVSGTAPENGLLNLSAPPGHVFTAVAFASYGTPTGAPGSFMIDPGCHSPTSMAQVAAVFLGQTSGSIAASNAIFGDPCSGIGKSLYVTLIATETVSVSVSGTVNEPGLLNLTAPPGFTFTAVEFASYGTPTGAPGSFMLGGCHAASSMAQVAAAFVGQSSGSIAASNAIFGDPCPGVPKRLYVTLTATGGGLVDVVLAPGVTDGATPGSDFTAGPITVSFGVLETSKTVPIEILGDTAEEADETVALSFASNSGSVQPTAVLTITNDDFTPEVTPPGIPDTTIFTSSPQATVGLFPAFEDMDHTDTELTYTVTGNTDGALVQASPISSANGLLVLDTPCTLRGSADITVRATDPDGLWVEDTFTVTVTDDVPPVLTAKDIVLNAPAGISVLADFSGVTALDKVDGPLPVTCTPDDSAPFPVGVYVINCQATDLSGNTGMTSFRLFVLEIAVSPGMPAIPAPVAVTGSPAPGAGGPSGLPAAAVLSNPTRLYLNDAGDAAFEASLLGVPAANNAAVFSVLGGMTTPLAVKGVGGVSSFNHLSLAPDGDTSFRSDTGADFLVRSLDGGGADSPGLFPRATTQTLYQHAKAGGTDDPVVPGIFRNGVAGVTALDDTFLSTPALLVQEGDAAPVIPGATYGQIKPRAVAGSSGMLAFSCSLRSVPTSLAEAVLAGPLAGPFALVAREGDTAPDTGGAVLGGFSAESINGAGRLALKASLRTGGAVTISNNDVLLTNRNGFLELLAREGSPAPCIATPGVVFGSFREVFMGDDGSVVFLAFLAGAVGSGNDGTLWRSDASGAIHLLAREGEAANNTEGIYQQLLDASASASGRAAFRARLVPGLGDATTANALGLWAENPAVAVPQLVARQGDTFELAPGDTRTLTNITLDTTASAQGGSGGYGRVLGDGGHVAARLSLSGNASGAFILDILP